MTTTHVSAPTTVTLPEPGRYRIDPARSALTFTTRHLFGLGRVKGGADVRDGEISVADPPGDSSARARIATGSFHSGSAGRDAAILSSRLLDAASYPFLTFTSSGLECTDGRWVLHGQLTVRDQTGPLDLHIDGTSELGSELQLCAGTRIDRYAFGITKSRGLATRYLDIRLNVVATRV
jgi:polyisoprenoid-binding protein YceI